ncbi:MAG: hypothetical protein V1789_02355 [PVC group bacterium]
MASVCAVLALLCLLAGIMLVFFPRTITRISRVTDREYSTDKLKHLLEKEISIEKLHDLLNKQIDINDKLLKFDRLIGAAAIIMGIIMVLVFFKAF